LALGEAMADEKAKADFLDGVSIPNVSYILAQER
jgi:hypothetical protein